MKRYLLAVLLGSALSLGSLVTASAQHQHGGSTGKAVKADLREVVVEGAKVIFQIMPNKDHQKMLKEMNMKEDIEAGTTHNITVVLKDEKGLKEITNAEIHMKVINPEGKDQIKPMRYEGAMKSYDAYADLSVKGKYQVMVLFRVGQKKRSAGIYHEEK